MRASKQHIIFTNTNIFYSTETTVSSKTSEEQLCSVSSSLAKDTELIHYSTGQQIDTDIDPFESIQEWLNKELGGQTEIEPEFRSESPIFDDWDDIAYDSNDDDEFDFFNSLSPPDNSLDGQSQPGSEGYGTDTSDLNELLNNQPSTVSTPKTCAAVSNSPAASCENQKTVVEVSKSTECKNKVVTFTSNQTVCTTKVIPENNKPRILSLKNNRIQGKIPGEAKITKVYQIPSLNGTSTIASKVGTQSRKTVVVKVLKPKNG